MKCVFELTSLILPKEKKNKKPKQTNWLIIFKFLKKVFLALRAAVEHCQPMHFSQHFCSDF